MFLSAYTKHTRLLGSLALLEHKDTIIEIEF